MIHVYTILAESNENLSVLLVKSNMMVYRIWPEILIVSNILFSDCQYQ